MKITTLMLSFLLIAMPALARQRSSGPGSSTSGKSAPAASPASDAAAPLPTAARAESALESKVILYGEKDVVKLKTKLRYTTLIILPKAEKILDFSCGDAEWWRVEGSENFAYVKPAKAAAQTNLNLITASGNIYSFALTEISESPDAEPDLKVFVDLKDESMLSAVSGPQRFVSANEIDKYRKETDAAKAETNRVKQITNETIEKGVDKILKNVRCSYAFNENKKPFYVSTICHDDRFTYISLAPEETPTLYEVRDGPNLVNFTFEPFIPTALNQFRPNSGILTVQKIVQHGYLAIGKERLYFSIKE